MTHPLAVYTVIYLAILFVTVSIWGSGISGATGDTRVLLFALGAFSLKLAIDDYVHFQGARRERLHVDLLLSLLIYLFLAGAIAHSAIGRTQIAALLFAMAFLVGAVWIVYSGLSGKERPRRIGWLIVNCLAFALLCWAAALEPRPAYTTASIPLTLLFLVIVADFFFFGTLRRLADIADPTDSVIPQIVPAPHRVPLTRALDDHTDDPAATPKPAAVTIADATTQPPTTGQKGQDAGVHDAG